MLTNLRLIIDTNSSVVDLQDALEPNRDPEDLHFVGDAEQMETMLNNMTPEQHQRIKKASIAVIGNLLAEGYSCCTYVTCLLGCLLCIPFVFPFCQWWKKITFSSYSLPSKTYEQLGRIFECP